MKARDRWHRDDRTLIDWLHRVGNGRVLRKTHERPGLFVVLEAASTNPLRALLIQHRRSTPAALIR